MTYGIIGAMEAEITLLTAHMEQTKIVRQAGFVFYDGLLGGSHAVVVKCGIGKVNAAVCAQVLIDRFAVDALINTGVAGGVSPQLHVCDAVIGTALLQHDFDLTPFGHARGYMGEATGGDHTKPTLFAADAALSARLAAAARAQMNDHACFEGVIASGDVFVADADTKAMLYGAFGALAAEMEGAAIAQAASMNGVPFAVLRTISDLAGGDAPVSFETVVQYAADLAARILLALLQEPLPLAEQ